MSETDSVVPLCDIHCDDVAQALCKCHKKLLCLSCVLKKAKSPDCSITELRRLYGDYDSTLYECLLVGQMVMKKKRLIEDHENKTETLQKTLKQQVIEFHEKLVTRLNEMKEYCLNSIDTQAGAVIAQNDPSKQKLESFEKLITENLEMLSAESPDDLSGIQTKLKEVKSKLSEEVPDNEKVPEGQFLPSTRLEDFSIQSGCSLGKVYLISPDRYAAIDTFEFPDGEQGHGDEITNTVVNKESDRPKNPVYMSSDEVIYDRETVNQRVVTRNGKHATRIPSTTDNPSATEDSSKKQEDDVNKKHNQSRKEENMSNRKSREAKAEKTHGGMFRGLFSSKKSEEETETKYNKGITVKKQSPSLDVTEKLHQDTVFTMLGHTQPRYLINRTVTITGIQPHFSSACKFAKLVYLEEGYIGMLSRAHNSLLLTSIDGKISSKKIINGLTNLAAVAKDEIATIVEKGLQVSRFKVANKICSTTASFIVSEDISNITGFDFDESTSQFAISSPEKLVIVRKDGKNVKATTYAPRGATVSDEVVTTYDFSNGCLYTLNKTNKTLKCLSFEKTDSEVVWKLKFDSYLFTPRNVCLYKDILCVSGGNAVAQFIAGDGTAIVKQNTNNILDECSGICVIDDAIVFSSDSADFDTSTKLGFIKL